MQQSEGCLYFPKGNANSSSLQSDLSPVTLSLNLINTILKPLQLHICFQEEIFAVF